MDFKFKVSTDGQDFIWVAGGRDDLEAEGAVEAALEADGEEGYEIELIGEATQDDLDDLDDHNTLFATER